MTNEEIDAEVERAFAHVEPFHFPKAVGVEYSPESSAFVVSFEGRIAVTIPQERFAEVIRRNASTLPNVTVSESGYGLEWSSLDVSYDLPKLIEGIFRCSEPWWGLVE